MTAQEDAMPIKETPPPPSPAPGNEPEAAAPEELPEEKLEGISGGALQEATQMESRKFQT